MKNTEIFNYKQIDNSNHYNFIWSVEELRNFVEKVLKPIENSEVYLFQIFFRSKYVKAYNKQHGTDLKVSTNGTPDKCLIKSNSFNEIYRKINKLHTPIGTYFDQNGKALPTEGIVCYLSFNPYSTLLGYNKFVNDMNNKLGNYLKNDKCVVKAFQSMPRILFSCINKSRSRRFYMDMDFDISNRELAEITLKDFIKELKSNNLKYHIVETRGGYHVLIDIIETEKEARSLVFKKVKAINEDLAFNYPNENYLVEYNKNEFTPIPGTFQGGFKVRYLGACK